MEAPASTLPPESRLAIIGTPRGGLDSVSAYLTGSGLPCGHEEAYHWGLLRGESPRWVKIADASWLAVPLLPEPGVKILQVVRHPLDVITSIIACGLLEPPHSFFNWAVEQFPVLAEETSDIGKAAAWWLAWTQRGLSLTTQRIRLENVWRLERRNRINPDRIRPRLQRSDLPDHLEGAITALADKLGYKNRRA